MDLHREGKANRSRKDRSRKLLVGRRRRFRNLGSLPNATDQVHPILNAVAREMLYGGDVTARSAGRTHLLSRSLVSNPSLSGLVRSLSFRCEMDSGHVDSLITILQVCTETLESLTLSAVYLKSARAELYTTLQATSLRSFSYGFHGIESDLDPIVPLLTSFRNLKELVLDRVAAIPPGAAPSAHRVKRGLRLWGAPPTYALESISITNWHNIDAVGWPLEMLDWLFGSTKASLKSLHLCELSSAAPLGAICDLLADRSCHSSLEKLTVRDFRDGHSLEPRPLDPNSFATIFPNLTHLSLMTNADESSFHTPKPHLVLPARLRVLQVDDDLFLTWRLLETVQAASAPATLRRIRLRGPFPSDIDVKALKRACERKGVACEVLRPF